MSGASPTLLADKGQRGDVERKVRMREWQMLGSNTTQSAAKHCREVVQITAHIFQGIFLQRGVSG